MQAERLENKKPIDKCKCLHNNNPMKSHFLNKRWADYKIISHKIPLK